MKADLNELALSVLKTVLRNNIDLQVDWILRSLNDHTNAIFRIIDFDDWGVSPGYFRSHYGSPFCGLLCEFQQPQVTQVLFSLLESGSGGSRRFLLLLGKGVFLVSWVTKYPAGCKAEGTLIVPEWFSSLFWSPIPLQSSR